VSKSEFGEFLQARRAAVSPRAAGIPDAGSRRRVPGLRREEVAALVGLSTDYYVRLEQGRGGRPSESVLDAIASALLLDDTQRDHLWHLAHPARRSPVPAERLGAATRLLVDSLTVPALVMTASTRVIGWNSLACNVFTDFANRPIDERNTAWLMFRDADVAARHRDWDAAARDTVGMLRLAVGENPDDPELIELVDDLAEHSPVFHEYWTKHHVYEKSMGVTQLRHPVVGDIDLVFTAWRTPSAPHQALVTYLPEPASPSARALEALRNV
jgi:transcriptional regulator with XRE-family HTH domain